LRQLERDISHITGCTNNIQHVVGTVRYANVASVEQRYTLGAPVVNGSYKKIKYKSCKLTAVSMSSSMRARSLSSCSTATKALSFSLSLSAVANLKDDWQPPSSALPEVRQYRKQLVQHVTALPFGVGVGASTYAYTERSSSK
jgi:hypothetical protein